MTQEGWLKAVKEGKDDPKWLDMLAKYLSEIDEAKQILIDKGYRLQGQSLLSTVNQIPDNSS